ncbi:hypothetical protein KW798_00590 [Candidatus Parcubacteria bacterium]|nr:hypothetical protein [Candidatus Parcubacteria bacterium]
MDSSSTPIPPVQVQPAPKRPIWVWVVVIIVGFLMAGVIGIIWLFAHANPFPDPVTRTLVTTNNCGDITLQLDWFTQHTFEINRDNLDLYYIQDGQKESLFSAQGTDFFVGSSLGGLYKAPLPQNTNIPTEVFETPTYSDDDEYSVTANKIVNIFVDPSSASPQQFNDIASCFRKNLPQLNEALNKVVLSSEEGLKDEYKIPLKFGGLAYISADDLLSKISAVNSDGFFPLPARSTDYASKNEPPNTYFIGSPTESNDFTIQQNGIITRKGHFETNLYFGDIFAGPLDLASSTSYYKSIKNSMEVDFLTYLTSIRAAFK